MNRKCIGCGLLLQNTNPKEEGFTPKEDSIYCQRCFKLINYGSFKEVKNKDKYFFNIFKKVNEKEDLILFLVDIFNLSNSVEIINNYVKSKTILVLTKKDILPKSVKDEKLKKYIESINTNRNIIDTVIISSKNNYNIDYIYDLINKEKISKDVYIVGNTNSGKSTFINKIVKNYSDSDIYLTTSIYPSTTLENNRIKINDDLYLIDTPGVIDKDNINNYVSKGTLKRITPSKEIKPRVYQLLEGATLYSENLFRLEYVKGEKNSFTIYISNDIIIDRINTMSNLRGKTLVKHSLNVKKGEDIVISGLCFIKVKEDAVIDLYSIKDVKVFIRNSLI